MRIEVEERKANIVTICDERKIKLTDKNTAYHAKEDHRHGIMSGFELSVYIHSNEFARRPKASVFKGDLLDGKTDLCLRCHKVIIQWYLDHIEPGSCI